MKEGGKRSMNWKKRVIIISIIIFAATLSPISTSTNIIEKPLLWEEKDQYQEYSDECVWLQDGIAEWQEFTPSKENLVRVEVRIMKAYSGSPPLILEIHKQLGTYLTRKELLPGAIPDLPGWVSFDFPDILVTPGDIYYIVLIFHGSGEYAWWGSWGNPYPKGISSRNTDWDYCFRTYAETDENHPPEKPLRPIGESKGKTGDEYIYASSATDPDGDRLCYLWDWGDGTNSDWLGPYDSGQVITVNHTWEKWGYYEIKVKAKDEWGVESDWSDPLIVIMSSPQRSHVYSPILSHLQRCRVMKYLSWGNQNIISSQIYYLNRNI